MNRTERRLQAKQQRRAITPAQRAYLLRTAHHIVNNAHQITAMRVLSGSQEFTSEEQIKLTQPLRIALERMKAGAGNDSDFHDLACAVNILIVCAESIGETVLQAANEAAEALMRSLARQQIHQRHGLDGMGIQALTQALDVYEQLTELVTKQQFRTAVQEAARRMDAGHTMQIKTSTSPA